MVERWFGLQKLLLTETPKAATLLIRTGVGLQAPKRGGERHDVRRGQFRAVDVRLYGARRLAHELCGIDRR